MSSPPALRHQKKGWHKVQRRPLAQADVERNYTTSGGITSTGWLERISMILPGKLIGFAEVLLFLLLLLSKSFNDKCWVDWRK
jgi:hypothetical protein